MELGALDRLLPNINLSPFRSAALHQLDLEMVLKQHHCTVGIRVVRIVGPERNRNGGEVQWEGGRVVGVQVLGWVQGQAVFDRVAG
jgi:hypothetical protein